MIWYELLKKGQNDGTWQYEGKSKLMSSDKKHDKK